MSLYVGAALIDEMPPSPCWASTDLHGGYEPDNLSSVVIAAPRLPRLGAVQASKIERLPVRIAGVFAFGPPPNVEAEAGAKVTLVNGPTLGANASDQRRDRRGAFDQVGQHLAASVLDLQREQVIGARAAAVDRRRWACPSHARARTAGNPSTPSATSRRRAWHRLPPARPARHPHGCAGCVRRRTRHRASTCRRNVHTAAR